MEVGDLSTEIDNEHTLDVAVDQGEEKYSAVGRRKRGSREGGDS